MTLLGFVAVAGGFYLYQGVSREVKALEFSPPDLITRAELLPQSSSNSYRVNETLTLKWYLNPQPDFLWSPDNDDGTADYTQALIFIGWSLDEGGTNWLVGPPPEGGISATNLDSYTGSYEFEISPAMLGSVKFYLELSGTPTAPEYILGPITVSPPEVFVQLPPGGTQLTIGQEAFISWTISPTGDWSDWWVDIDLVDEEGNTLQDIDQFISAEASPYSWEVIDNPGQRGIKVTLITPDRTLMPEATGFSGVFTIQDSAPPPPPNDSKTGIYLSRPLSLVIAEKEEVQGLSGFSVNRYGNGTALFWVRFGGKEGGFLTDFLEISEETLPTVNNLNQVTTVQFKVQLTAKPEDGLKIQSISLSYTVKTVEIQQVKGFSLEVRSIKPFLYAAEPSGTTNQAEYQLQLTSINSYSGQVALEVLSTTLPVNVKVVSLVSFVELSPDTPTTATLQIGIADTDLAAPVGQYEFTVTASSSNSAVASASANAPLWILPVSGSEGEEEAEVFSAQLKTIKDALDSPGKGVDDQASYQVVITPQKNYQGSVTMELAGGDLPSVLQLAPADSFPVTHGFSDDQIYFRSFGFYLPERVKAPLGKYSFYLILTDFETEPPVGVALPGALQVVAAADQAAPQLTLTLDLQLEEGPLTAGRSLPLSLNLYLVPADDLGSVSSSTFPTFSALNQNLSGSQETVQATVSVPAGRLFLGTAYAAFIKTNRHLSQRSTSDLTVSAGTTSYQLTFPKLLAGDTAPADRPDDQVNSLDFTIFLAEWSKTGSGLVSDFDNNLWVSVLDVDFILSNFLKTGPLLDNGLQHWLNYGTETSAGR